jgi:hypothetical protein
VVQIGVSTMADINTQRSVTATLNFAFDKSGGGRFSNDDDALIDQHLKPAAVKICNARLLAAAPILEREGMTLTDSPLPPGDWSAPHWVDSIYIPHCLALVQRLTGVQTTLPIYGAIIRMEDPQARASAKAAPPAWFVHIDQPADSIEPFLATLVDADTMKRCKRPVIYNVWRLLTPPPQRTPLAICDQQTIDTADLVEGLTVSAATSESSPYVTSVFSPDQRWYYFPDMTPNEAIVFKGVDSSDQHPLGCLHCAFEHPNPSAGAVPRISIEVRVVAFYEQ